MRRGRLPGRAPVPPLLARTGLPIPSTSMRMMNRDCGHGSLRPALASRQVPADLPPHGAVGRDEYQRDGRGKRTALSVLSSDCISSSAYGSEEILLVLIPLFGLSAYTLLLPMTGIVLVVLVLVTLTYRWVVTTSTAAGGSYVVAR